MEDDMKSVCGDAVIDKPGTLGFAHEDDSVEGGEAARAADDFGKLCGWVVEGAHKADIWRAGKEVEESEVPVCPEVVDDACKA